MCFTGNVLGFALTMASGWTVTRLILTSMNCDKIKIYKQMLFLAMKDGRLNAG